MVCLIFHTVFIINRNNWRMTIRPHFENSSIFFYKSERTYMVGLPPPSPCLLLFAFQWPPILPSSTNVLFEWPLPTLFSNYCGYVNICVQLASVFKVSIPWISCVSSWCSKEILILSLLCLSDIYLRIVFQCHVWQDVANFNFWQKIRQHNVKNCGF